MELWTIPDKRLRYALLAAQRVGRIPVTAEWLYKHPDCPGYLYRYENDVCGLDCWTLITGIDSLRKNDNRIILEFGTIGEQIVDPDFVVYVSKLYNHYNQ